MTHTVTHVMVALANPFIDCDQCGTAVIEWHDPAKCCGNGKWWNSPCGDVASIVSACPTWSPVDGCTCAPVHHRPPSFEVKP